LNKKTDGLANLFRVVNLVVLPFWLLMLIAPRWSFTQKLMKNNVIFLAMGGLYTGLLATGIATNPGGMKDIMNPELDSITKLLGNRQGAFTGWVHFLTFDLFVGRWIYLDSLERGKPARLSILLSFVAGPIGLTSYTLRNLKK